MDSLATFLTQYNKPLSTAISFVLVILMSISLANGALFFIEHMNQGEVADNRQAAPTPVAKTLDTSQIRDLFGKYQDTAAPQSVDAPKTTLNLELQGIFTAEIAADSSAIVAQRGQSGELYRIGDRLPGNATLEAVHDDHILIKRGARTEKLPFSDSAISAGFSQTSTATPVNINTPQPNVATGNTRLEQVRERIARRSQELAQKRNTLPRQSAPDLRSAIDNFQKRLDENPAELLTELGVDVVETEKGSGYRIGGEVSQTMLRQAGLKQGDVVLSVNGQPASSVANDKNLMDQVMQSERVRVEVQRDDRRFYVTVPIPQ
ncbi:MAG: general secretion pathway protein C [Candidatus Azotimanducaceae bacterium]|jgi:general secretion pathway protein C